MATSKHFIQDRSALLLVSANTFLALLSVVLILLKVNATRGTVNYIVSYRSSLGIDGYTQGTFWDIMSFVLATIIVYTIGMLIGYRAYKIRRELALVSLALTIPLLVLIIIVSNALLFLR